MGGEHTVVVLVSDIRTLQGFLYIPWHGERYGAVVVVPALEGNATVLSTIPIGRHFVFRRNDMFEVLGMFTANILEAEIVDNKAEADRSGLLTEEAGCVLTLDAAIFGEVRYKVNVGKTSGLC
jgi:hypothetical protein